MRARWIGVRLGAAVASLLLAAGAVTAGAAAVTSGSVAPVATTPPTLAPTAAADQRVAFTDDSDGLLLFAGAAGAGTVPGFADATTQHEGEISNEVDGLQAFVSTRDDPQGQVYVVGLDGTSAPVQVTCDGATKTHPVISPSGTLVAYATDAGGSDRIRVADISSLVGAAAAPPAGCAGIDYRTLAGQGGQNRWPSWVPTDPTITSLTPVVVYSSTRDNPLGDLYEQAITAAGATRLTDGSAGGGRYIANTQPSVTGDPRAVLFTTTMFREDGSIGEITLPSPADNSVPRTVHSAWNADPPQGSAASFDGSSLLAFTGTAINPLGGVQLASDTGATPGVPLLFDVGSITGIGGSNPWLTLTDPAWATNRNLYATARWITADVRDVRASDGSGGRLIAHAQFDDDGTPTALDSARPDYSPDASKIAYSQQQPGTGNPGRRIVVANADGSDPVLVQDGWQDAASNGTSGRTDLDVQPAWSPDGTKIAFVRAQYEYVTPGAFTLVAMGVRVVDLSTDAVHTVAASGASDPYFYQDPAWSPDGTQLVMSRSPIPNLGVAASATPDSILAGDSVTVTVTVTNSGVATARDATVTVSGGTVFTLTPTAGCAAQGAAVLRCSVGTLAAGDDATFTISATSASSAPSQAQVEARASASSADADVSDNVADATVDISTIDLRSPLTLTPVSSTAPATPVGIVTGDAVRGLNPGSAVADVPRLWIADAATGAGAPLAPPAADCSASPCALAGRTPAWSPDGTQIAYDDAGQIKIATLATGPATLLAMAPSSTATSVTALTGFASFVAGDGGRPTASRAAISTAHDPRWSGKQVYFTGQPAGQPDDGGIYAVSSDGSGLRAVAQLPGPQSEAAPADGADLSLTLTASPATIAPGETSTVTATVTDNGNDVSYGGFLAIDLPAGLTLGATPSGCTLTGAELVCPKPFLDVGDTFSVQFTVTGATVGTYQLSATVEKTRTPDPDPSNNTATTTIQVIAPTRHAADLAVSVAISQPTGYVGGKLPATVTVTNHGPDTALGSTLTVTHTGPMKLTGNPACLQSATACPLGDIAPGVSVTRTVALTPTAAGSASLTGVVAAMLPDPVLANNTATATLELKAPTLRMLPGVGPPGRVSLAYGTDFPPGSKVTLVWKPGVTTYAGPFTVAADGTLRVPELVVRRDVIGTRFLVATSTTKLFTKVHAVMLVVPRTESPPRFLGRN